MSLRETWGPELPYLRRYARALTGSQIEGDQIVVSMLDAVLAGPAVNDDGRAPRLEMFRLLHQLPNMGHYRHKALLLSAVEGFSMSDIAIILGKSFETVIAESEADRLEIRADLKACVMIIEDEPIIALHLRSIVDELGCSVTGIARTRAEAVALAAKIPPGLVLADISLADGSSGIDAVNDILADIDVPIIFVTAFPERLLTGERPEPTYLVTKPFEPETVIATIGQALLVHRAVPMGALAARV